MRLDKKTHPDDKCSYLFLCPRVAGFFFPCIDIFIPRADSNICSTDKLLLVQYFLLPAAQAGLFYGSTLHTTTALPSATKQVNSIGADEAICTPTYRCGTQLLSKRNNARHNVSVRISLSFKGMALAGLSIDPGRTFRISQHNIVIWLNICNGDALTFFH
ncbi:MULTISPECIES: hypothetical protein [Enterobacter]|uniref:hypothetical protein n=1 Tax=Enterobacter TaxID=547 RepID=UPI0012E9124B|nr:MULTISPECIES: hypothetical protein [Enterobacter]EKS6337579.1 hypothetical protein [Enterobacter hormaechei]